MDFGLNDEQLALRDAVRRFCDEQYPAHQRGDACTDESERARWQGLTDMGLTGLCVDEAHGGMGMGATEVMLVAQELGRALDASAWLGSSVLAARFVSACADPAQQARWLPALASGQARLALALEDDGCGAQAGGAGVTAIPDGAAWVLHGQRAMIVAGDRAHSLLIAARLGDASPDAGQPAVFRVDARDAGVALVGQRLLDGRGVGSVHLRQVRIEAHDVVGPAHRVREALDLALDGAHAALCAEIAGALEALLEITCEHLRTRRQFGVPLARFQSLQHAIADMAMDLEQVKSMAAMAAMAVEQGTPEQRVRLVAAARVLAAQVARRGAFSAIQLHGAMGMTEECRVSHYAKRLITAGQLFGDASHHATRFAAHRADLAGAWA